MVLWLLFVDKEVCNLILKRLARLSSMSLYREWLMAVEYSNNIQISLNSYCINVFAHDSIPIYRSTPAPCLSKSQNAALSPPLKPADKVIHYISYRYMTPAALLFSLYSSKLPIPPSAPAPSPLFCSLSLLASHSSSSEAIICSNLCCWPLAR